LVPDKKKKTEEKETDYVTTDPSAFLPPIWSIETFSEEKRQKIKAFRESKAGPYITKDTGDLEIARWLIARKWDMEASIKMYIDSITWREKENINSIFEWIPKMKTFKFLNDYWPNSILPDKSAQFRTYDGYLVVYEKLCAITPHILQAVSLQDLRNFHIYIQELTTRERKRICEEEKSADQYAPVVYVQDLEDLTMSHLTRQNYSMMNSFTDIDSLNYPETVRKVFIINAPAAFTVGWKISQKFLDPATIDKVAILGTEFKAELLKVIPPASLPEEYGGTLHYKIKGGGSFKEIKAILPKLVKQEVHAEFSASLVIEQGVQVSWKWRSKNDICFGVFYQSSKDSPRETILELTKHDPEGHLEEGLLKSEKVGLYTLLWDNSNSWMKRKLKFLIFFGWECG